MKLSKLITVMALATTGLTALTAHADATVHHYRNFTQDAVPPLSELKINEGDNWVTIQSPKMTWFSTAKQ